MERTHRSGVRNGVSGGLSEFANTGGAGSSSRTAGRFGKGFIKRALCLGLGATLLGSGHPVLGQPALPDFRNRPGAAQLLDVPVSGNPINGQPVLGIKNPYGDDPNAIAGFTSASAFGPWLFGSVIWTFATFAAVAKQAPEL